MSEPMDHPPKPVSAYDSLQEDFARAVKMYERARAREAVLVWVLGFFAIAALALASVSFGYASDARTTIERLAENDTQQTCIARLTGETLGKTIQAINAPADQRPALFDEAKVTADKLVHIDESCP